MSKDKCELSFVIRLTPSNCPTVSDLGLYESYPWFEMMVKLQNITRDPKGKSVTVHSTVQFVTSGKMNDYFITRPTCERCQTQLTIKHILKKTQERKKN